MRDDLVAILDAKYEQHVHHIECLGCAGVTEQLRVQHRADRLQALAYATLFDTPRMVTLLAYPCGSEEHPRLVERRRAMTIARLGRGRRYSAKLQHPSP